LRDAAADLVLCDLSVRHDPSRRERQGVDNTLLRDVVRVLTRLIGRLAKALELRRIAGFLLCRFSNSIRFR
jgi:hypothetical protein